jgi:hypothetical protein
MTHRTAPVLRFAQKLLAVALPAALVVVPKTASAQQWLRDQRVGNGPGIQAGDLELHPGLGGEVGYDSNFFLRTSNTGVPGRLLVNGSNGGIAGAPDAPPRDAVIMRITPSFNVNTRNKEVGTEVSPFFFSGGVSATYMEFFGNDEIRKQRNVAGAANLRMDVNRGRPVGFDVYAGYSRLIQPNVVADPNLAFNRSDLNAGADINFVPGGGTLDLKAGYQVMAALFEESEGVPYTSLTHEVSFRDRWRFRPRTALFHDTTLRFMTYPYADRASQYLDDSTPLRTRFGVTGLLTDRFGALLAAGYGATFFKDPTAATTPQYDSVNGQAEVTWYLSSNPGAMEPGQVTLLLSTINLGFIRDFQNSLIANVYTSNKGYLRFNYFVGPKAVIQVGGDVEDLEYESPFLYGGPGTTPQAAIGPNGAPVGPFSNLRIGGLLFAEYRLLDSLGLNTTINYDQMISNTLLPAGVGAAGAPNAQFYDLSWKRFRAFVGLRWFL